MFNQISQLVTECYGTTNASNPAGTYLFGYYGKYASDCEFDGGKIQMKVANRCHTWNCMGLRNKGEGTLYFQKGKKFSIQIGGAIAADAWFPYWLLIFPCASQTELKFRWTELKAVNKEELDVLQKLCLTAFGGEMNLVYFFQTAPTYTLISGSGSCS